MGTLTEEENGERGTEESNSERICTSDPLVYQLVRVEGDGRLIPATDDELMEVENLLEDDRRKVHPVEAGRPTEGYHSIEELSLKESDFEGLSPSESLDVESRRFNARLEACDEKLQPGSTSMVSAPHSTCLNGSYGAQAGCVEPENEAITSRSSVSEACTSSEPNFSLLKGDICLDDLTMRELQEAFRATFGRQTSVKDKLWLKRRIVMGLTNSCDVLSTNFVIKENKKVKEAPCNAQPNRLDGGSLSTDQVTGSRDDSCQDSPYRPTSQIEDGQVISGRRLRKTLVEYDTKNENLQIENCAAKRVRKPTKRYIEELSDIESRECTVRMVSSTKNCGHEQSSPKYKIMPVCDKGFQGTAFVTRKDSLGGSGIQVPYVSRVRRRRPRKNFFTLMNFVSTEKDKSDTETYCSEDQVMEHENTNPTRDSSDNNTDVVPTLKLGAKRKHHRAWTLCEVLKLVEGVARYGAGRWSEIRRLSFASYSYRTSVDLKDKWRNLLRASFAQEPPEKGAKNFRKHTAIPIPTPILLRVRELAEMHSQTGIEFGPSKFSGHSAKILEDKGSGFL